jgi:hypothetical protein
MERQQCSKDNPYSKDKGGKWCHPDAEEIDEDYGKGGGVADGDYVKYKCPNCGHTWREELPN